MYIYRYKLTDKTGSQYMYPKNSVQRTMSELIFIYFSFRHCPNVYFMMHLHQCTYICFPQCMVQSKPNIKQS